MSNPGWNYPGYPQPGYPPQPGGYPQPGYPPQGQPGYPPGQPGYPSPHGGYPQGGGGYPQGGGGYSSPQGGGYAPFPGSPITQPPSSGDGGGGNWMNTPSAAGNVPRGLEYLTMVDQLLVQQKVELLEAFVGFETANKYSIKNTMGQKVYYAAEENDCCTRNCCGPIRPFTMKILDNNKQQVMTMDRPLACDSCWFPCCLQNLEVRASGQVMGSVVQNWSVFFPDFSIKDAAGNTVLKIEGPFCTCSCCGDVDFEVKNMSGQKVGKISKQWSGLVKEAFTDADTFGVSFPMDLDVRTKATLMGAVFLIDFMFFEKVGDSNDKPGMWQ